MRIALVHDWFNEAGGAEKVLKEILYCFPDAEVFCLFDFFDDAKRNKYLAGKTTKRSFIQHIPFAKKYYRFMFPLFPLAIEQLDLSPYDLIISSSYCVAKGIKKQKWQVHVCYCHSPVRYAWDLRDDYLEAVRYSFNRKVFSFFLTRLRKWDKATTNRVDYFIANSENVSKRIQSNYDRTSVVIYPPVEVGTFTIQEKKSDYYFTASRLVSYKKKELLLKAFGLLPHLHFQVAGDGPTRKKLEKIAPPNVEMLGYIDKNTLIEKIKSAKAFVAAANEDFGITIVEAQACGTPVIVPYLGGYKETVLPTTGLFFKEQTVEDIVNAITQFEQEKKYYRPIDFIDNVSRFNQARFHHELIQYVSRKYSDYKDAQKI